MFAVNTKVKRPTPPTDIHQHALGNLRYIRQTIEAAETFTSVPGQGGIAMGCVALLAAGTSSLAPLHAHWLSIWLLAAVVAATLGVFFLVQSARCQERPVFRGVTRRFLLTLTPPLIVGAALTAVLTSRGFGELIPAIWLLTYGAGVTAVSVLSIRTIALMGACFMLLGLIALVSPWSWANAILALGFGGFHIGFGLYLAGSTDG